MEYRPLGDSGIQVSLIGLGTMTFGEQNTPEEAFAQLDRAVDAGVNLIDTAELYPVPPREETYGRTEAIIGQWLARRPGMRARVVIATKAASRADWIPWIRGGPRLNRKHLEAALEGSLRRLGVETIDLYQLHWPDRNTNFFGRLGYEHDPDDDPVPLRETLEVLADFVRAGKVRAVGLSNETPWGVMHCLALAREHGLPRVVSVQNPYNLLNRTYEIGLAEVSLRERVGLLAYSPLAFGVLSGKYLDGAQPAGARLTLFPRFDRYSNARARRATEAYVAIAREAGLSPAQMALAYVNSRPFLTSNLIGATTLEQLEENLASVALRLPEEVLAAIEAVHADNPNPSP